MPSKSEQRSDINGITRGRCSQSIYILGGEESVIVNEPRLKIKYSYFFGNGILYPFFLYKSVQRLKTLYHFLYFLSKQRIFYFCYYFYFPG